MEILNNLLVMDIKRVRLLVHKLTCFGPARSPIRNRVFHLFPEKISRDGETCFLRSGFGDRYSNTEMRIYTSPAQQPYSEALTLMALSVILCPHASIS